MVAKDEDKIIKDAIKKHKIDVPIMDHKLVGNRMELYLYGGGVIKYMVPAASKPRKKPASKAK